MERLTEIFWHDGQLFGIEWTVWKAIGWLGNAIFFSRFFVQWFATEKRKQVVVPTSFWWLSLIGSLLLLAYGLRQQDSVFIFAYAFTWIPYIRNLIIHHRAKKAQQICAMCEVVMPASALYCSGCGAKLALDSSAGQAG